MVWARRSCSCTPIPQRFSRVHLYLIFTFTLLYSILTFFLNSMTSSVCSEEQTSLTPANLQSHIRDYNPENMNTHVHNIQMNFSQSLNFSKDYPQIVTTTNYEESMNLTSEPRPHHMVWDTTLSYTDRIVEQINYVPKRQNSSKTWNIFVWEKEGEESIFPGTEQFIKDGCLVSNCFLMSDQEPSRNVDAFITSILNISSFPEKLKSRVEEDVWIYYKLEHPEPTADENPIGIFNWTATYRHDSIIVAPYEKWVSLDNSSISGYFHGTDLYLDSNNIDYHNYAYGKRKMAAALISNCQSKKRMSVVLALSKYIQVDIYGKCGYWCGNQCLSIIKRDYKFYLAFESAKCTDYITEKLFTNALSNDIVPVVFGAPPPDYWKVAPPFSYIHVDNFPSLFHLATYMMKLDQNDNLYNAYFKWKGTGSFINTKFWCRLCALLNDRDKPRLVIPDIYKWLTENKCA